MQSPSFCQSPISFLSRDRLVEGLTGGGFLTLCHGLWGHSFEATLSFRATLKYPTEVHTGECVQGHNGRRLLGSTYPRGGSYSASGGFCIYISILNSAGKWPTGPPPSRASGKQGFRQRRPPSKGPSRGTSSTGSGSSSDEFVFRRKVTTERPPLLASSTGGKPHSWKSFSWKSPCVELIPD
jgi:hypothetical protein